MFWIDLLNMNQQEQKEENTDDIFTTQYDLNPESTDEPDVQVAKQILNTVQPATVQKKLEVPKEPKPKQTYAQDWKAYDQAKRSESIFFKEVLYELLSVVDETISKTGRPSFTLQQRLFMLAVKVYNGKALRNTESLLKETKNYINKAPCFKSLSNFLNDKRIDKILDDLILISALPVTPLENIGAMDATGFSTSRFDKWVDYKWGKVEKTQRHWKKAHAISGTLTNVVFGIQVTEKNVADPTMFEPVFNSISNSINIQKFVADRAYLSRKILNYLHKLSITPYIPFKSNSVGTPRGSMIWRKMYDHFTQNHEEWTRHYHKRSNAETVFHMVKKRFGDSVTSKTDVGMRNEIKLKFLCHNICVLIQEFHERNIDICVKTPNPV